MILTIKSTNDIKSERISKSEQASANRWHHEIRLGKPGEVDKQIVEWLREAYEILG